MDDSLSAVLVTVLSRSVFGRIGDHLTPHAAVTVTSGPGPSLVRGRGAGPQQHGGSVGGQVVVDVETQAGLDAPDGAVGVDRPLLVGTPVAVPDLRLRAGGGVDRGVETLAERLDGLAGEGP